MSRQFKSLFLLTALFVVCCIALISFLVFMALGMGRDFPNKPMGVDDGAYCIEDDWPDEK